MNEEINSLKLEIEVLKKRVASLEAIERNRKIIKIIKGLIFLCILVMVVIFAYKWYKEIMDFYNKVNNFMNNPLKSFI